MLHPIIRFMLVGFSMPNVENVNYDEFIKHFQINVVSSTLDNLMRMQGLIVPPIVIGQNAQKIVRDMLANFNTVTIPAEIIQIIEGDLDKKQQIRLLKDLSLTPESLHGIFSYSSKRGYLFSNYIYRDIPKMNEGQVLPSAILVNEEDSVTYYGEGNLTDAHMRALVNQQKVLIARIIDNGKHWYCFLQTFMGIKGEENGAHGSSPHIHFLSDAFGMSKEELIIKFRTGKYPTSPIHIKLNDYRK